MENKTILSGMRPTGKLHLGHWVGALSNWTRLQEKYHCYFMVADWHALMSEYKDSSSIKEFAIDNVADWLSCGIDPNKSNIFIQSQVPEHLELSMILSVMVPLGWLLRCPTFKDQVKQLKDKEVNTYAFLGYPVLQSADILLYKADTVPVGEDQLPHLELCREIVRKFHLITKTEVFIEPQPLLTNIPRFLGIDGRKMSKSYKNDIALDEDDKNLEIKVLAMFTDPQRKRRNDPGRPQICNVFSSYLIFKEEFKDEVHDWCIKAKKGCRDCKKMLYEIIKDFIAPIREKKEELLKDKNYIKDILEEGRKKAKNTAIQTIKETRE
ncbi:MAG: tryptophan--tRNA ligase, partial [Candidatus Omnitrophica bacterium]|nr:tryptophan--tRNA ligase [Candidatus Omnitrophota bacterium]